MQSLAVKYRPHDFKDLTEQKVIVDILTNQVNTKTFKHAYLFTGPAGTGKTTSARIFADMLNNGHCIPIEIDAASNSGVDNIRTVIEDSKKRDLNTEYKVFIIDECHSLSNGAWQAMLKLLEEPPKYSVFILCTTDPQKIPNTIMSRVQRYHFNKISTEGVIKRLKYICAKEKVEYEEVALSYIAKVSNGGMRDAITLLDKCLSLNDIISLETVLKTLGREPIDAQFTIVSKLCLKDETVIGEIEKIYSEGKDLKQFMKDFAKFTLDCAKYHIFNNLEYTSLPDTTENIEMMKKVSGEEVLNVVDLILEINSAIKWENDPKALIEMLMLKYCKG